jgi:hypothetical protein
VQDWLGDSWRYEVMSFDQVEWLTGSVEET